MNRKRTIIRKRMEPELYASFQKYQELSRIEAQVRKEKERIRQELKAAFAHREALLSPNGKQRIVKCITVVAEHLVASYEKVQFSVEELL